MKSETAQSVLAAIPVPAVLIRPDERIEAANPDARRLLGDAIAGRHFITALRQPVLLDAIESTLRDGAPRDTRYLTNDGRQDTTFRVTVRPVNLTAGQGALVCFEDMTHLEQAGQMRRDFVANVSHELRTPLTAVLGFIETLKTTARDDPAARARFLSIMEAEAGRMNRLVGDLLSLSRVEAEERMRPTELVDPVAILASTVRGLEPLASGSGAQITLSAPDNRVFLPGDGDQLRQVFTNLIENAVKYGGPGVAVSITVSPPEMAAGLRQTAVQITVADTGPGIDAVHVPRLTERFYRVDTHRSREQGGTGLGLAIVKHIVNRHRGRMRIDSAPGQGTRVTILLPVS